MSKADLTITYTIKIRRLVNRNEMKAGFDEMSVFDLAGAELSEERRDYVLQDLIETGTFTVQVKDNENGDRAQRSVLLEVDEGEDEDKGGMFSEESEPPQLSVN